MSRSEQGSVTIEATIVISLVLVLLFGCLGTLLTIFVDSQMDWSVQSASDEMNVIAIPLSNHDTLLVDLMKTKIDTQVVNRSLYNLIDIRDISLENINGNQIKMWEISYDYKFLSFADSEKILIPFKTGNENDGLKFESSTVYITTYGEKYHMEHCFHLRKSKFPIDLDEASSKGYDPCKNCHKSIE